MCGYIYHFALMLFSILKAALWNPKPSLYEPFMTKTGRFHFSLTASNLLSKILFNSTGMIPLSSCRIWYKRDRVGLKVQFGEEICVCAYFTLHWRSGPVSEKRGIIIEKHWADRAGDYTAHCLGFYFQSTSLRLPVSCPIFLFLSPNLSSGPGERMHHLSFFPPPLSVPSIRPDL